jgi:MFS family permease
VWVYFARRFTFISLSTASDINNVGSIAQSLLAHSNPTYDEAESAIWQAAQVSAISLASFSARILIGIVADTVKSRLRVPRSFCLPAMTALFILSQLLLIAIGDVRHLWMASVLLGLAYGCWFGLLPTISIEWFGLGAWKSFPLCAVRCV